VSGPSEEPDRVRHATNATSGLTFLAPSVRSGDMTYELNNSELDLVSGGDLKESHFNTGFGV
jgi:hypothetical protein